MRMTARTAPTDYKFHYSSSSVSCFQHRSSDRAKRSLFSQTRRRLTSREHEVRRFLRLALLSGASPCDIRQPRYHQRLTPRDVVKCVSRFSKGAQLSAGVDGGNIPSPVTAVERKNDFHHVEPRNPKLCVSVEAVGVGAGRAQRKRPCAWESERGIGTAISFGGTSWRLKNCESISCQWERAS